MSQMTSLTAQYCHSDVSSNYLARHLVRHFRQMAASEHINRIQKMVSPLIDQNTQVNQHLPTTYQFISRPLATKATGRIAAKAATWRAADNSQKGAVQKPLATKATGCIAAKAATRRAADNSQKGAVKKPLATKVTQRIAANAATGRASDNSPETPRLPTRSSLRSRKKPAHLGSFIHLIHDTDNEDENHASAGLVASTNW